MYNFFGYTIFIIRFYRTFMKCFICEKELSEGEEEVCSTCKDFMKSKYSKSKKLNARLKCHKEQAEKLKQ
jgi:hypothetical protein